MNFIRPGLRAHAARARDWAARHSEPLVLAVLGVLGAVMILRALGGGWLELSFGAALVLLAAAGGVNWWRRARFGGAAPAAGVVEITEARLGYLGPQAGGYVDLDALSQIDLVSRHRGAASWRLLTDDGQLLEIPLGAEGAEDLIDAFAALPGLEFGRAAAALEQLSEPGRVVIWRRQAPQIR